MGVQLLKRRNTKFVANAALSVVCSRLALNRLSLITQLIYVYIIDILSIWLEAKIVATARCAATVLFQTVTMKIGQMQLTVQLLAYAG